MNLKAHIISSFFLVLITGILQMPSINAQNIADHRWERRILLIYSDQASNQTYAEQLREFDDVSAELADRQLIVYQIIGSRYCATDYVLNNTVSDWNDISEDLKKYAKTNRPFYAVLIGLDGGVKLEQHTPITKERLFATIDAMPMRRAEMENKREDKND